MKVRVAVLMVFATAVASLSASNERSVSVSERTRGAKAVVVANVSDVSSRFDTNQWGDQLIVSDATLQVDETLKGAMTGVMTMTFEGGTVGDLTLSVSDMPTIKKGERAVFFLEDAGGGRYRPHRRGLGILKLDGVSRVRGSDLTLLQVRRQVRSAR